MRLKWRQTARISKVKFVTSYQGRRYALIKFKQGVNSFLFKDRYTLFQIVPSRAKGFGPTYKTVQEFGNYTALQPAMKAANDFIIKKGQLK